MKLQANRHLISAHLTLSQTLNDINHDNESSLYAHRNNELSTTRLFMRILRNKRLERKAVQSYNRTVSVLPR